MEQAAGWIASAATMIAAMMTASNLGTRVTGWGFVVFTVGSAAWVTTAVYSGQTSLLVTNAFLLLVNMVGVWRWLGRQARYEDGGAAAERRSEREPVPELFALSRLAGADLVGAGGARMGRIVDAMARRDNGRPEYLVVAVGGVGGVGEQLFALNPALLRFGEGGEVSMAGLHDPASQLPQLGESWPAQLPPMPAA